MTSLSFSSFKTLMGQESSMCMCMYTDVGFCGCSFFGGLEEGKVGGVLVES